MSQREEIYRVQSSNWHLQIDHISGEGIEFTLRSGSDSLELIIQYLKVGFSYGTIDPRIWKVRIIRGLLDLEVFKPENLDKQEIKNIWPDCDASKASVHASFFPRYYKWVGEEKVYIEESDAKLLTRTLQGNSSELESILKQVFT